MIVELSRPVREIAIEIRKKQKLKLPDAVIAASSIHLDFPLITMDTDFEKVNILNTVVIDIKP
jgi:predicted nucleic acid-binding protein